MRSPRIYGHRGAPGHRPEHTLASYRLGARMGSDYIEPDLVSTSDHVLVARHEPAIGATTDVAGHPEFASRRTTKVIDGITFADDWFAEDFTLAELKTLRAKERIPDLRPANAAYDGREAIPSLAEVLALDVAAGVVPELKHPAYFRSIGLPQEEPFAEAEAVTGGRVVVQCFEEASLRALARLAPGVPRLQLFGRPDALPAGGGEAAYGEMAAPAGLREVASYADIAAPPKTYIVPRDADGRSLAPTAFVAHAQAAGLQVATWTFRDENAFLPLELRSGGGPADHGDAVAEYLQFFRLGVDAVFSDHPDTAVRARDALS